jgi:hypothetical protein
MKVLPTSKAFEKNPDLVAALLTCWVALQPELRDQVFNLLVSRKWITLEESENYEIESLSLDLIKAWPIFPLQVNRSKLPGFYTHWPRGEDFEVLYNSYLELFPAAESSIDKVSLMVVWLTMRLPYHVDTEINHPEKNQ